MSETPPADANAGWRQRLRDRAAMLGLSAAALLLLVFAGELGPVAAFVGFAGITLGAALLPVWQAHPKSLPSAAAGDNDALSNQAFQVADALPDPCLILNRRGLITHRNPVAARDFPNARAGDPLVFSFRSPAMLGAIEAARRSGRAQSVELHQTVPTETWHKVFISPLGSSDAADERFFLVTLHNFTEQKRIDAMRADFVANASHELRTPLTSLIGFIDTLLGPAAKDPVAQQKFLGIMRAQAERMSKLIDDLLSLGRIEMRQHVRPTGSVDLAALIGEVRDGLQTQAREAGATIAFAAPAEPVIVTGDRDELYEVFENLIDNALKYGGDGGSVEVSIEPLTGRPGLDVAVAVTDHGAGIAPEYVPRLTERFYRVDAESSRRKKGTGLGLAIVKHILNRHHGLLAIKSRPGAGTRVEVLLPK